MYGITRAKGDVMTVDEIKEYIDKHTKGIYVKYETVDFIRLYDAMLKVRSMLDELDNEQNIEQIKEKLLEKFKEHCYPVTQKDNSIEEGMTLTGITQVLNEVFSNIESLDNEWVDVRDRLPSKKEFEEDSIGRFLVTDNFDGGDVDIAYFDFKEKSWHTECAYYDDGEVTAWKPLPKPYERKGQE